MEDKKKLFLERVVDMLGQCNLYQRNREEYRSSLFSEIVNFGIDVSNNHIVSTALDIRWTLSGNVEFFLKESKLDLWNVFLDLSETDIPQIIRNTFPEIQKREWYFVTGLIARHFKNNLYIQRFLKLALDPKLFVSSIVVFEAEGMKVVYGATSDEVRLQVRKGFWIYGKNFTILDILLTLEGAENPIPNRINNLEWSAIIRLVSLFLYGMEE